MAQPKPILVFALGCLGALAPEVLRLYKLRNRPPKFSAWYWCISVVYALLGGVVAVLLPAVNLWAALYAGITTPTLISTAARHRSTHSEIKNMANARYDDVIRASEPEKPGRISRLARSIRNHADGLFL